MKRNVGIIPVFIFFMSVSLHAFDFGGKISSLTKYQGNTPDSLKWYESATGHLWMSSLLNDDMQLKFNADGSYEFRFDETDSSRRNIADLNLFKISGTLPAGRYTKLYLAAGRFSVMDVTGLIFKQVSDGFYTKFQTPPVEFSVYAGCTSFLNAHDVTILTPEDTSYSPDFNSAYVFCPGYIPVGFSVYFPSLFLNQSLTAECWGFADLSSDKYNRWYGTVSLSGPLSGRVFYSLSDTVGTEKFDSLSVLSKAVVTFYPVPAVCVSGSCAYASGNNGFLSAFRAFTSQTAYFAFSEPEYTGMVKTGLSGSYTIASNVCLVGEAACIFLCPGDALSYGGWQWNFNTIWNIFHDLQLSAGAYQYYASDAAEKKTCFNVAGTFVF